MPYKVTYVHLGTTAINKSQYNIDIAGYWLLKENTDFFSMMVFMVIFILHKCWEIDSIWFLIYCLSCMGNEIIIINMIFYMF